MPSISVITPILGDRYYHLFNRGNSNLKLFYTDANYLYFLQLYDQYLKDYCETLAYCLIPNHFHLVIKTKAEIQIVEKGTDTTITNIDLIGKHVSGQLRKLFIAYAQAIKKQENINGNLFSKPFKRLMVEDDEYLKYVIFYVHHNPVKHGISDDFQNFIYSSYKALLSSKPTKLDRKCVLELFGSQEEFIQYHQYLHEDKQNIILE